MASPVCDPPNNRMQPTNQSSLRSRKELQARLVIVEGIMGSGKSTTAQCIATRLQSAGQPTQAVTDMTRPSKSYRRTIPPVSAVARHHTGRSRRAKPDQMAEFRRRANGCHSTCPRWPALPRRLDQPVPHGRRVGSDRKVHPGCGGDRPTADASPEFTSIRRMSTRRSALSRPSAARNGSNTR